MGSDELEFSNGKKYEVKNKVIQKIVRSLIRGKDKSGKR